MAWVYLVEGRDVFFRECFQKGRFLLWSVVDEFAQVDFLPVPACFLLESLFSFELLTDLERWVGGWVDELGGWVGGRVSVDTIE